MHSHSARMLDTGWKKKKKNSKADSYTKIPHMGKNTVKMCEYQHDYDINVTTSWDWKEK